MVKTVNIYAFTGVMAFIGGSLRGTNKSVNQAFKDYIRPRNDADDQGTTISRSIILRNKTKKIAE